MATNNEANAFIELKEEEEGNLLDLEDLFFKKVGPPIPLNPKKSSNFDLQNPPTQALAVSENPQAVFLAHSEGFYVVRIKQVIEAAKEMGEKGKTCSIQEICLADVQIGRPEILAVSTDSSTLSACVGGRIHLFSITSLLNKEKKPSFSCSLDESSVVKDFCWRKKKSISYLVLSRNGVLYQGDGDLVSFKQVMNSVDAVDWSAEGHFIAVAKKNNLCILSSKLRERFTMSLSSQSWVHDTNSDCIMKVDSIKWVRQDCMILGCFQITEEGVEAGYFVQIISSRDGNISEASSKSVVLSFNEVFTGIIDDIVPSGCGPYLFLNYLKHRELLLVANRKNADQHIILFGWSSDDEQKEVALMELAQEDRWLPRVGLQENEDDNLILGFGVESVSSYEKLEIMLGGEQKELSTYCILLCLTLDGKLLLFYVAGSTESLQSGHIYDEEDSLEVFPSSGCSSTTSLSLVGHEVDGRVLDPKSEETNQMRLRAQGDGGILNESGEPNDFLKPPSDDVHQKSNSAISNSVSASSESVGRSQAPLQCSGTSKEQKDLIHFPTSLKGDNANVGQISWQQGSNLQTLSANTPIRHGYDSGFRDAGRSETQNSVFSGVGMGTNNLARNIPSTFQLQNKDLLQSGELGKGFSGNLGRVGTVDVNSLQSGSKVASTIHVPGSQSSPSNHAYGDILNLKDPSTGPQSSVYTSGASTQLGGQRSSTGVGKFESGSSTFEKSLKLRLQPMQENLGIQQPSSAIRLEPELSKKLGSVTEMAKQLDTLLSYIEGEGGFSDACILFQRNSVLALEQCLQNLSARCRGWKNTMQERLQATEHLLDKTVQVLARKIYMEGIVKQASDSQYWDLWNRQKLSPELEMRRRKILKVNEDLTNQLVELERHFNTLELLRFGENSGVPRDHRISHSEPSRHGQSYHRLYSTMNSQLVAAEQLSDCLTKQMTMLKIESPAVKRQSVAKELFESIGLTYDGDSFSPPKGIQTPDTVKQLQLSSSSVAIKMQSRRNLSSAMKTSEPETARRRRDSLGRSWTSVEPPKTTVKRMTLQEKLPRVSPSKSSLVTNRGFNSLLQQGYAVSSLTDLRSSMLSSSSSSMIDGSSEFQVNQDLQGKILKQMTPTSFTWANDQSRPSNVTGLKSPTMQVTQRNDTSEVSSLISSRSSTTHFEKSIFPEVQSGSLSISGVTSQLKATSGSINCGATMIHSEKSDYPEVPSGLFSKSGVTSQMKTSSGYTNNVAVVHENSSAAPVKNQSSPFAPLPAFTPAINLHGKAPPLETATSETQAGVTASILSPTIAVSISVPSSSSPAPSPTSVSASANLLFPSTSSSVSQPDGVGVQQNSETSVKSTDTSTVSADSASASPAVLPNNHTNVSIVEPSASLNTQPNPLSAKSVQSSPMVSVSNIATDGKGESLDVAAVEEDEMEEEAPDTTFNLSLGGLGSFGLGSASSSPAPKPNAFGGPFQNAMPKSASNPFNMTVPSGELFRPASFSFQPVQPSQLPQPTNTSAFSGGFNTVSSAPEPTKSAFGQPVHIGAGQQALGSVLGSFGQSRQLGGGLPRAGFGPTNGLGGSGFMAGGTSGGGFDFGTPASGGFANAATGGGFTGVGSIVGGFAGIASGAGGFAAAAASTGGGFAAAGSAGGRFGAAASGAGGGFGAFSNNPGGGAFSAFSNSSSGNVKPPSELFTQMRK